MPRATHELHLSDGAVIQLRAHGQAGASRIVLSHGNGLAIDGYAIFWEQLCEAHEVVVFDMRSHGRNPCHGAGNHHWARFAQDMAEIWAGIHAWLGRQPSIGAFHSLSSIASLLHSVDHSLPYEGLVLFDPPLFPPAGHPLRAMELEDMALLSNGARRRREHYDTVDELADRFRANPAFHRWQSRAYDDMAAALLRPRANPEGPEGHEGFELSCPRDLEANVFAEHLDPRVWERLFRPFDVPLKILGGDPDVPDARPPAIVSHAISREAGLDYHLVPDTSHFLQLEAPDECARIVLEFARTI